MAANERLIRDGKVAVLYSPGFGAGWSTWASAAYTREALLFAPELAAAVDASASGAGGATEGGNPRGAASSEREQQ